VQEAKWAAIGAVWAAIVLIVSIGGGGGGVLIVGICVPLIIFGIVRLVNRFRNKPAEKKTLTPDDRRRHVRKEDQATVDALIDAVQERIDDYTTSTVPDWETSYSLVDNASKQVPRAIVENVRVHFEDNGWETGIKDDELVVRDPKNAPKPATPPTAPSTTS